MKKQNIIIGVLIIGIILLVILLAMDKSETPTTASPTPSPTQSAARQPGDSKRDPELFKKVEDFQRQNHPDVFLKNKLPYETSRFTVDSNFVKATPSGHFHFTISLKGNKSTAKNEFIIWLQSLGLTNEQITTLDITYQ